MIRNLTRATVLARDPRLARSLSWRLRGMIGRDFTGFDALVFTHCGAIHMFFMRMPLDVVFVDANAVVRGLAENLAPWRLAGAAGARLTIELPVGAIAASGTQVGDRLELPGELPPAGRPA